MEIDTFSSGEFLSKFMNNSPENMPGVAKMPPAAAVPLMAVLTTAYCILLIVGVSANLWTAVVVGCVLFGGDKDAPKNIQIYIFALCSSNVVVLASLGLLVGDLSAGYWVVGSSRPCYFYLFAEVLNKFFGPFLLAALSGTCCVSVCFHAPRSNAEQTKIAAAIASGCFAAAVCLTAPVFVYGDVYYIVGYNETLTPEYIFYIPKCMFNPPEEISRAFLIYAFVFGYSIPALLFSVFYGVLLCFLKHRSRSSAIPLGNSAYFAEVAKTTMGLVSFYLICWTPYWSLSFYQFSGAPFMRSSFMTYLSYLVHLLPYVNCAGYPLIYTLLNKNIKKAYERVIRRHHTLHSIDAGRSGQLVRLVENGCAFLFAIGGDANNEDSGRRRSTRTGLTFVSHGTADSRDSRKSVTSAFTVLSNDGVHRDRARSILSL